MGQAIAERFFFFFFVGFVATGAGFSGGCRRTGEAFLEHDRHAARSLAAFTIPIAPDRAGEWLAGDFHCHVSPPDNERDVKNGFDETMAMARAGGLDFVVLVPHVRGRFYENSANRRRVARDQRRLAARTQGVGDIVVIPGVEYTDGESGHIGISFVDLAGVLESHEPFFEAVTRRGGILNIHHPFARPVHFPFTSRGLPDMSWRPFTMRSTSPPEIALVHNAYDAIEIFNHGLSVVTRVLRGDRFQHLRQALAKADTEVVRRNRPIALIGGSDNHSFSLRATTYLFAKTRDPRGIAEAVRGAHTCAMGPDACSLQVRSNIDPTWRIVGDTLRAAAGDANWVDARWRGRGTIVANGEPAYRGRGPIRMRVTGDVFLRLETEKSFSSHIVIRVTGAR